MKSQRYLNLIFLFFFFIGAKPILASSYKVQIYNAYINNRIDKWKVIIDEMEGPKHTQADLFLAELINYQYGYIGYCLAEKNKKMAKIYLNRAEANIQMLESTGFSPAAIHAYKSAFWGYKIAISPLKAPFYGGYCLEHANCSLEADNSFAFGHMQYAIAYSYMPGIFGGSDKIAIEHFLMALKIMETELNNLKNDWNYLNLLILIGQTYEKLKDPEKAKYYKQKILEKEPTFVFPEKKITF